jgi:hypothetical protein
MLKDIFLSYYPKGNKMPKNLRLDARDFATHNTGHDFSDKEENTMAIVGRPGRSSGSNN